VTPRASLRTRPADTASCGGCEARWRGIGQAHCAACHRSFSAVSLFDRHRRRDVCLDPLDIRDRDGYAAMRLVDGVWRGREMADEQRARFDR
jgi:hypothetical protein